MKKLIISVVLSTPFFLISLPSVANQTTPLDNSLSRTGAASVINNNSEKSGINYAYWYRGGYGYRWHHWHRWHRWNHWHRWHRW